MLSKFDAARTRLIRLSARWPGRGAVEHSLGVCELHEGHPDAALAAWGRVPTDAPEVHQLALRAAGSPSTPAATGSPRRASMPPATGGEPVTRPRESSAAFTG